MGWPRIAPITSTTGATSRYGTELPAILRRVSRRRAAFGAVAAAAPSAEGNLSLSELRLVEGLRDVVAGDRRRLLDAQLAGEDLGQHRLEDVAVLDVDPVLRLRDEPAASGGPLVDAGAEQVRCVRDVPLRLQCLLGRRAREVRDPLSGLRLRVALN